MSDPISELRKASHKKAESVLELRAAKRAAHGSGTSDPRRKPIKRAQLRIEAARAEVSEILTRTDSTPISRTGLSEILERAYAIERYLKSGDEEVATEATLDLIESLERESGRIDTIGKPSSDLVKDRGQLEALPPGTILKTLIGGKASGRTWVHMDGNWWGVGLEWGIDEPSLPARIIHYGEAS